MKYADLLAFVTANCQNTEQFYLNCGPNKREQEDDTGVQVVSWNVGLLADWLAREGEPTDELYKAWEQCDAAQQREVWEASSFHWGMCGYDPDDADHFWKKR